jgi:hypothetical protein
MCSEFAVCACVQDAGSAVLNVVDNQLSPKVEGSAVVGDKAAVSIRSE